MQELQQEHGFVRMRRMILGDVPTIETIGIITAQNPNGQPFAKQRNLALNKRLLDELQGMNCGRIEHCGAVKIQGVFGGHPEDSFIIPNLSRNDILRLQRDYQQKAVIWGRRRHDRNNNAFFDWEYIEDGKIADTKPISVSQEDVQSRDDFFSAIKTRKFIIPFFNDPYSNWEPGEKYGTIEQRPTIPVPQEKPHREPDELPIFAEPPLRKAESFKLWLANRKLVAEKANNC